jgi:hypothetical protein
MDNYDLPGIVETTAKNMYEMLTQLADHIRKLESENAELKQKLEAHRDDLK